MGSPGYHSAVKDVLPQTRKVMDPFHVVHLAAEKLTVCRQRVQQETLGHRAAVPANRSTASIEFCWPAKYYGLTNRKRGWR
nr:transposase [Rhodococcus sp. KBS0724]